MSKALEARKVMAALAGNRLTISHGRGAFLTAFGWDNIRINSASFILDGDRKYVEYYPEDDVTVIEEANA